MPIEETDEDLPLAPTIPVADAKGVREIRVCPGCGRPETEWTEAVEATDGHLYCCGSCAIEEPCVCGNRAT
jgi:hypothetical protein